MIEWFKLLEKLKTIQSSFVQHHTGPVVKVLLEL